MAARILVQSGIAAGTTHWIERSVVRVGSDPGMDLTIPCDALDKHALTLEFRDGVYRVHNRCSAAVYLGGRTVAPANSDQWFDTDLLELPGAIQLAMEVEGDPAPVIAPPAAVAPSASIANPQNDSPPPRAVKRSSDSHPSNTPSSPASSTSSTMAQVAVIVICVLGCVLLLARDRMRRSGDAAVSVPKFEVLVDQARLQADPATQGWLRHVQYAESAMIRGNEKAARQRYASVRAMLMVQPQQVSDASPSEPESIKRQMMQWVEYRLGQL